MPSVENVVVQVASELLRVAGLPPEQVRLAPLSLKVTVPVAPVVTVAVSTTGVAAAELLAVYAVVGLGVSVVVLEVDAPL
jgi:hypothetical protein